MAKVELIYDASCPNVEAARQQLRRAFQALGQLEHMAQAQQDSILSGVCPGRESLMMFNFTCPKGGFPNG